MCINLQRVPFLLQCHAASAPATRLARACGAGGLGFGKGNQPGPMVGEGKAGAAINPGRQEIPLCHPGICGMGVISLSPGAAIPGTHSASELVRTSSSAVLSLCSCLHCWLVRVN